MPATDTVGRPLTSPQPSAARRSPTPQPGLSGLGFAILLGFGLLAAAAPLVAPYDPAAYSGEPLARPSPAHLLGTNDVGQDILSELIYGSRVSLLVGLVGGSLITVLAAAIGTAAGYLRGWADWSLMRVVDFLMAIPHLPLMLLLAAYAGPGLLNVILVIVLLGWMVPARVVRAQTLIIRGEAYVEAARALGASSLDIMCRHVLPALGPILVSVFVAQAARAITLEAGLAFLGLGDPTVKSWGLMLRQALSYRGIYFPSHWLWWLLPPGLCVSLLVLGITLAGVGLEAKLDPRLRSIGKEVSR